MSDMIERVGRALADAVSINYDHLDNRATFNDYARAAIDAMREPTDGQRNAYYELSHKTETMFDAHWERAIDAALLEQEPQPDV